LLILFAGIFDMFDGRQYGFKTQLQALALS
jgi:hypothetical protein